MKPLTLLALLLSAALALAAEPPLQTLKLHAEALGAERAFEGQVEAERQTQLAAQVAGAVTEIAVRIGDKVRAGQLLLKLDARGAEQGAQASAAQAQAARAGLALAQREFERQRQLQAQGFISQGALDQAEAQFKATQAQLQAQLAGLQLAHTQTAWHRLLAPYDGVVAELPVALGDLALPGRPLVTVYDPARLRVSASLPQQQALPQPERLRVEIPALDLSLRPTRVQALPLADAGSQTQQLRLDLPPSAARPGQFARLWLPGPAERGRIWVPLTALVRRGELRAVYVLGGDGQPLLRQLRLGQVQGQRVEVLAGLNAGEQLVLEPQRAARLSGAGR